MAEAPKDRNRMISLKFYNILIIITILTGCATVTRSSYERFVIITIPEGAKARLSSGETCTTPCNLLKKRHDPFTCLIEKQGYEPVEIKIEAKVAGAGAAGFAGNVAIGGLIGAGVDIYSGSALSLVPNPVVIELKQIGMNNMLNSQE